MKYQIGKKQLIETMQIEYTRRLYEALRQNINEVDVLDKQGNIVVSPGLKVRHKNDNFEYTVEDINKDEKGNIQIALRVPEAPRVMPDVELKKQDDDIADLMKSGILEIPADIFNMSADGDAMPKVRKKDEKLIVTQKEFEDEYEVNN